MASPSPIYPIYAVAFGLYGPDAGSTVGHASLLLLAQPSKEAPWQLIDTVGFYGITPGTSKNPTVKALKKKLGMDIDFTGGYGELRPEEPRYIDRGSGLKGRPFQLTRLQFRKLRNDIAKRMEDQTAAIQEAKQALVEQAYNNSKIREVAKQHLTSHGRVKEVGEKKVVLAVIANMIEISASDIMTYERAQAKREHRKCRLQPFELKLSPAPFTLFSFAGASTCNSQATRILEAIGLDSDIIDEIGTAGSKVNIPYFSGSTTIEDFHIRSQGEVLLHKSSKGVQYPYRPWREELPQHDVRKTKLFLTLPPRYLHPSRLIDNAKEVLSSLTVEEDIWQIIAPLTRQLQCIEQVLLFEKYNNDAYATHLDYLHQLVYQQMCCFQFPIKNKDFSYVQAQVTKCNNIITSMLQLIKTGRASFDFPRGLIEDKGCEGKQTLDLVLAHKTSIDKLKDRLSIRYHFSDAVLAKCDAASPSRLAATP